MQHNRVGGAQECMQQCCSGAQECNIIGWVGLKSACNNAVVGLKSAT